MKYPTKRQVRKVGRKVYKATGLKNPMKKGKLSLSRVLNDVAMLKKMVNAEKKRHQATIQNAIVGQLNGSTGNGYFLLDVTPNPPQGVGYQQKTGNSIKWHSSHYDFQFFGQGSTVSGIKLKIQWVKVIGLPYTTVSDIFGKYIMPNPFLTGGTIYDINSNRDPDYFKNFKVIKTQYISLKPDQITGDINVIQKSMGFKLLNHHVRNNDNDPTLTMGQVFMLITADRGNCGTVGSSITGTSIAAPQTGAIFSYNRTDYFYDN